MACSIPRSGSAPCCLMKQELNKQAMPEKIKYPLSHHDVLHPQNPESFSSSSYMPPLQNLHNQAELNSKDYALYDPGNGMSQPRYVVSPTYQNGFIHPSMLRPVQLPGSHQWAGVQNYENLYLTRSMCEPQAQIPNPEEHSKPPKKQASYGKVARNTIASNNTGNNEMDLKIFKDDNTILQVNRKMAAGQSSRNRAPLKVEEANELSSSYKNDDMQPRSTGGSIQVMDMDKSSRSVNESNTRVFHRVDKHQNDVGSDTISLCRLLKYLMVLSVGFIVGAGVHALVKCWTKDSPKK